MLGGQQRRALRVRARPQPRQAQMRRRVRRHLQAIEQCVHGGARVAYRQHVAARMQRVLRTFADIAKLRRPGHRQVVGEHRTAKAQFAAQHLGYPAARKTGWQLIDLRKQHVCHHDRGQAVVDQSAIRREVGFEIHQGAPIDWQCQVRIGDHRAVSGKMLGGGGHARIAHAMHVSHGQLGHHVGAAVEGPIADHAREAVVEIDAGREGKIEAAGQQFSSHQPAVAARQIEAGGTGQVELVPELPQRRKQRKPWPEALHPPAFLVGRHQQRRVAQRMNVGYQLRELRRIGVIACEQDHTAHQRVRQHRAVLGAQ